MKRIFTYLLLGSTFLSLGQQGAPAPYYNGFNWNLTGMNMKDALASKIISTHTKELTYGQTENAIRIADADPTNGDNVLMVYGYSNNVCPYVDDNDFGTSPDGTFHRSRSRDADVTTVNMCAWNREHIYAQALGTPPLGQSGPGADAHMLRVCDVDRNSARANRIYTSGSGNSTTIGSNNFYPGDEWKGDVARILMYMYLHYGTQCLPAAVATGTPVASDANMLDLLLQWNAEDPVSAYEDNRNTYLGGTPTSSNYKQGNRNPFIDNPYLATVIWGGPVAQNRWPNVFLSIEEAELSTISVYPNPSSDVINISSEIALDRIDIITINGQVVQQIKNPVFENNNYTISNLPKGFYFLKLSSESNSVTKKVLIN